MAEVVPRPLNMILIVADDLGARDLGCDGADLHETPAIDALAAGGLRFTQAYSASPVCTPSRAGFLTGRHPARLGITIWSEGALSPQKKRKLIPADSSDHLPLEEVTLAERLQAAGYTTGHAGKWHLGGEAFGSWAQGFDFSVGGNHWGAPHSFFWPYRGTGRFGDEFRSVPALSPGRPGDYLTDALTTEALRFINAARDGQKPFFLYLAHYAPHTPIEAKSEDVQHFKARLRPNLHHQNPVYAAMIKSLDENVARVLRHLDETGLRSSTLVVFTSDNGGFIGRDRSAKLPVTSNAPLRSGKGSAYEGGIRVPLIVSGPGVAKGACTRPVWLPDLFPTLLTMAGVRETTADDGVDLTPLLRDPRAELARSTLHWHYPHYYETTTPVSAIRSGDWKLLEFAEDGRIELFDLAADPSEQNDLAALQAARAEELQQQLHHWRTSIRARMPRANPEFKKP